VDPVDLVDLTGGTCDHYVHSVYLVRSVH